MNHKDKKILNRDDNDTVHFTNISMNGPLNYSRTFSPEYVWNHSFVKISYYSTIATTIKVSFIPQYLHQTGSFNSGRVYTFNPSPITLEEQVFDLTVEANVYKHFCLPVKGEMVKVTVEAPTYSGDGHTYLACCATKLQSAVNNS